MSEKLYNIKGVTPHDARELSDIADAERLIFSDPWSEHSLADACVGSYGMLVAQTDGVTAGYLIFSHVAEESELLRIAVLDGHRRRGVAALLVERYLSDGKRRGITDCFLEVRQSNTSAQSLYRKFGFESCGVRRAYYRDPVEDALLMLRVEKNESQEDKT